jgi:hypothetical protein
LAVEGHDFIKPDFPQAAGEVILAPPAGVVPAVYPKQACG